MRHNFDSLALVIYGIDITLSTNWAIRIYTLAYATVIIDRLLTAHSIYHAFNIMTICATRSLNRHYTHIYTSSSRPVLSSSHMDLVTNVCVCGKTGQWVPPAGEGEQRWECGAG